MLSEFIEKRNSILDVFRNAISELEQVNLEIASEVESNNKTIAALQTENTGMNNIQSQNNASIKNLKRILG
jgi:hypothetical protein